MPEGVEVELQVKGLQAIVGERIKKVTVRTDNKGEVTIRPRLWYDFENLLEGKEIHSVERIGKYIAMEVESLTYHGYLISHLKMTGGWLLDVPDLRKDYTRVEIQFESGKHLRYIDTRVFGTLRILPELGKSSINVGKDALKSPMEEIFTSLRNNRHRSITIKKILLDQKVVTGLGNVYANEALWEAGVFPGKKVCELSNDMLESLTDGIKVVVERGYKYGGLSLRDYYHVDGTQGEAQDHLNVYKQTHCPRCGEKLLRSEKFGRTSFWCNLCQPEN